MRALVTGATGFVGSWLTKELCKEGMDVRILCRRPEATIEFNDSPVDVAIGDVTLPKSLVSACSDIDYVFHLAGVVGYSRSMRPLMDKVNVEGTANIIWAAEKTGVKRLLHMSSVTAIGASFDKTPLNEESKFNLSHLNLGYFETKRAAEILVRNAVTNGRIDAVIVNPSTIYGPGDALKGSRKTQIKVARGSFPFYTRGGVNVIAVEDVVSAVISAIKVGRSGERYILSGENMLIKDLFDLIASEAGVKPPSFCLPNPVIHAIGKVGDLLEKIGKKGPLNSENAWTAVLYHWFDSTKAQKELGLKPKPAREAIARSIKWMKEHDVI